MLDSDWQLSKQYSIIQYIEPLDFSNKKKHFDLFFSPCICSVAFFPNKQDVLCNCQQNATISWFFFHWNFIFSFSPFGGNLLEILELIQQIKMNIGKHTYLRQELK